MSASCPTGYCPGETGYLDYNVQRDGTATTDNISCATSPSPTIISGNELMK